jgi:hypothetical protein
LFYTRGHWNSFLQFFLESSDRQNIFLHSFSLIK